MQTIEEAEVKNPKKSYRKTANKTSKTMRYFMAKQNGKTATEAREVAQFSPNYPTTEIEGTKTFQIIEQKYFKDILPETITKNEVAEKLAENIRNNDTASIKLYMDKAEPEGIEQKVQDNVIIVFKAENKDNTEVKLLKEDKKE